MKVIKVRKILPQERFNGLHLVQFECPRHWKPLVSSKIEVGRFPFSHNWTSGVIRMGSQYESQKVGNILEQKELSGLHLVQFECPRHWKPPVSANFEVVRFSILGNLAPTGRPILLILQRRFASRLSVSAQFCDGRTEVSFRNQQPFIC